MLDEKNVTTEEAAAKKKRVRKWITTILFVAFNIIAIAVVLGIELKSEKDSFVGASALGGIMGDNLIYFFVAFLLYAVHVLCDAVAYFAMIRQCGYGNRLGLALRVAILGKYYDNITPWSTGGQPFQIAYMIKANIDAPTASALPLIKYAIRIFFVDVVIITLFIAVPVKVSVTIKVFACVGIFTSTILPLLLIAFSGKVDFMLKAARWFARLLYKMKLVKDADKMVNKAQDTMDSFLAAFKYLGKHKNMIAIIGAVSVIDCLALASMPYFIICSLGGDSNYFELLTKNFYVTLSSGLMPTPGATGASEGTFYSVFASAVPEGCLFWAVLFWRMLVFYMPLLLGVIILIFDWIKGKTEVVLVKKEISWAFKKTLKNDGGASRIAEKKNRDRQTEGSWGKEEKTED